jgi:adenosine kinase
MNIIVSGSLAYDRIMNFPGNFSDHILTEKIHVLNVCFQVDGMKEKFGGTAGNIAYALMMMGEKPIISATIGYDYHRYYDWFLLHGIQPGSVRIIEEECTACAYITTDRSDNQITGFNPGAMRHSSMLDFNNLSPQDTLLIVGPGNFEDMVNYPRACKERGIGYILDPGQSLPMWDAGNLAEAIKGSRILIVNDYELDLVMHKTGFDKKALLEMTGAIITTLGESGSRISTTEGDTDISVIRPDRVEDPTGAGDAYRGGLISGLLHGMNLEESARMGSVCASFAVESYGTQEYRFTSEEFQRRLNGRP